MLACDLLNTLHPVTDLPTCNIESSSYDDAEDPERRSEKKIATYVNDMYAIYRLLFLSVMHQGCLETLNKSVGKNVD